MPRLSRNIKIGIEIGFFGKVMLILGALNPARMPDKDKYTWQDYLEQTVFAPVLTQGR